MKRLKDYLSFEHIDIDDMFAPKCLLQRSLYTQSKLANIIRARFPLLHKSYYDVLDLEFDLNIVLKEVYSEQEQKAVGLIYTLTTSKNLEERFAKYYPEKVL